MKKTLYISDLDGTLLNSRAEVSEKSKAIISRLITEKNILFSVATARTPATVVRMKERGIHIYAAHLEGALPYDRGDYTRDAAFLIGNEGNGLTDRLTELADTRLIIPMEGQLESLNASIAAGIFMYEAHRQKKNRAGR